MLDRKVGIIGAGLVGATTAYSLAMLEICTEIVLYDIVTDVAIGKAIDIEQSTCFSSKATIINHALIPADMKDCDIIIVTAGVPRKADMTRNDLLDINAKIIRDVTKDIINYSPEAIIICVSNPLDVMTYLMYKESGFKRNRVIGMAGALDSARMSYYIAKKTAMDSSQIKSMVLGEHGEKMLPCSTISAISGVPINQLIGQSDINHIIEDTKLGGATIVKHLKTSAYYAPARAITEMVSAILNDAKVIIPSSVVLDGEYGYKDTTLGVPVVLGRNGVEKIIELPLEKSIKTQLDDCVKSIKEGINILS
jgi:malate dehydrogenase